MAYMTKCALFTVAIALAAFAPACHAQTTPPACTNATGLSASYNCTATDTGMVATVIKYHHDAAMCGGAVASEETWTAAEFSTMMANMPDDPVTLDLASTCSVGIPDTGTPALNGKYMCMDSKVYVNVYGTADTTCTGDVLNNETVLPACECELCYSKCSAPPTNCTELGALTATGGCAASCVTTEGIASLTAFFTATAPAIATNCSSEWAAMAATVAQNLLTGDAAGGFWHLAPVMALVPVLFVLGL